MGQFLSTLILWHDGHPVPDLGLDIEHASPTKEELELYTDLHTRLVEPTDSLLNRLGSYVSPTEVVRLAMTTPSPENQAKAWDATQPTVRLLHDCYAYSLQLHDHIPRLLQVICHPHQDTNPRPSECSGQTTPSETSLSRNHPGLIRLFATLLTFIFEFDYLKMQKSFIQNDFSFYRRLPQSGWQDGLDRQSTRDNEVSLFIAERTPMFHAAINVTTLYVAQHRLGSSVGEYLAQLWGTCYRAVMAKSEPVAAPTLQFYLKVMVMCIVLYDHIDPVGAFARVSPINVKHSIKAIQTAMATGHQETSVSHLMFALKYNSKHLKDETTPKSTRHLVMA